MCVMSGCPFLSSDNAVGVERGSKRLDWILLVCRSYTLEFHVGGL